jgi:hypothetical protein
MFSPVVGNWTLYADWGSDGTYSSGGPIEFKSNQRFVEASYEGSWSQDGDSITFTYDGGTIYTGTLSSSRRMEGTMTAWNGLTGQWYAEKLTVK